MGKTVKSMIFFENGNVAVFDENGEQMPELQKGWINFAQIRKLAKIIADNDIQVSGSCPHLQDYVDHYLKFPPTNRKKK